MRLQKAMGWCTAQCKMLLFSVKTIVKESHNFELEKQDDDNCFGCLVTFWFGSYFRDVMHYHLLHVRAFSTYRAYRLYDY